jgi:hypothetical protein
MMTFSAPPTEATLLPGLINVVNVLPDNTAKEISPKDVRDSIYTLWHNSILKPTSVSGSQVKYIGIDQYELIDSPNGNVIYPKMYFGKKQIGGQFVMNDNLLGTNTDFFFYNTKNNQTVGDYHTTIAILAGTGSYLINNALAAPTLKSTVVTEGNGSYLNFDIGNSSFFQDVDGTQSGGDINIKSDKGYVSLNNFYFPKFSEHYGSSGASKDNYVLKYKWAGTKAIGVWESAFSQSITGINYPQGQVTINGNPIVLNGYNFTDNTPVATPIGGISANETFSNVNVLDMLRRIIYTYVPPSVDAGFRTELNGPNISIIERNDPEYVNTSGAIKLYYKFVINSTYSVQSIGFLPSSYNPLNPPLTGGGVQTNAAFPPSPIGRGTYFNRVFPSESLGAASGQSYKFITYTFSVADTRGSISSVKAEMVSVLPYFYGTNEAEYTDPTALSGILDTDENFTLNRLSLKLVYPIIGNPTASNNQSVKLTTDGLPNGQGYIYFGYPSQFPLLVDIRDNNGNNGFPTLDRFSTYSVNITSYNGRWSSQPYIFYISNIAHRLPASPIPWRFLFANP